VQKASARGVIKSHLCKRRFIGDVPFQYRERGFGGPPMLGSPLATARGTELLAHLHRSIKSGTSLGAHASGVLCSCTNQARWKRALPGQTALSSPTFNYTLSELPSDLSLTLVVGQ
jgi:hypothetical protein